MKSERIKILEDDTASHGVNAVVNAPSPDRVRFVGFWAQVFQWYQITNQELPQ